MRGNIRKRIKRAARLRALDARNRIQTVNDARAVDQDYEVLDELKVRLLDDSTRADADIRGIALQSLMWDVEVPSESVDVNVREGWVTLKGT